MKERAKISSNLPLYSSQDVKMNRVEKEDDGIAVSSVSGSFPFFAFCFILFIFGVVFSQKRN